MLWWGILKLWTVDQTSQSHLRKGGRGAQGKFDGPHLEEQWKVNFSVGNANMEEIQEICGMFAQ